MIAFGARGGQVGEPRPIWRGVHLLALAALALRLATALLSDRVNWADEIFQYLEQAHRLVYGYGIVPWEYRYGLRNWMLPGALAGVLELLQLAGADTPARYVPAVKAVFAVLSLTLVYSLYAIARAWYSETVARIAAVLAAFWYELVYLATLSTPEVLATYLLFGALALAMRDTRGRAMLFGAMLGLAVTLRPQFAPFAVVAFGWFAWRSGLARAALVVGFGVLPLLFAGALDAWTWGRPFASFVLSPKYNALYGVADHFGVRSPFYYPWALAVASLGLHLVALAVGLLRPRRNLLALLLLAAVVGPHLLLGHKEYRFITPALPLLQLLLADALGMLWRPSAPGAARGGASDATGLVRGSPTSLRAPALVAALVVAGASVLGAAYRLPKQASAYPNGAFQREPFLVLQLELSRRDDVRAVAMLFRNWVDTGGFYYMHRDVPLYMPEDLEKHGAAPIEVASHVLMRDGDPLPEGFEPLARSGDVLLAAARGPRRALRALPVDTKNVRLEPIESRFAPEVVPRF